MLKPEPRFEWSKPKTKYCLQCRKDILRSAFREGRSTCNYCLAGNKRDWRKRQRQGQVADLERTYLKSAPEQQERKPSQFKTWVGSKCYLPPAGSIARSLLYNEQRYR